ncbi:uncharacterized protein HD556DRAFT_1310449 [Suillus plorans]|uniref:Uncharacterized protein n=1 Tax=Suillus plorans TaxID=116603 RepID=A0A9P7AL29_9AGAM|nr:uncharacterized protein HD556DRAFT_1310449 [Suillus plorans]KAG1790665.1 hypothetical protein HD556DRAFT_1310449 [Suillus plorans]
MDHHIVVFDFVEERRLPDFPTHVCDREKTRTFLKLTLDRKVVQKLLIGTINWKCLKIVICIIIVQVRMKDNILPVNDDISTGRGTSLATAFEEVIALPGHRGVITQYLDSEFHSQGSYTTTIVAFPGHPGVVTQYLDSELDSQGSYTTMLFLDAIELSCSILTRNSTVKGHTPPRQGSYTTTLCLDAIELSLSILTRNLTAKDCTPPRYFAYHSIVFVYI